MTRGNRRGGPWGAKTEEIRGIESSRLDLVEGEKERISSRGGGENSSDLSDILVIGSKVPGLTMLELSLS